MRWHPWHPSEGGMLPEVLWHEDVPRYMIKSSGIGKTPASIVEAPVLLSVFCYCDIA